MRIFVVDEGCVELLAGFRWVDKGSHHWWGLVLVRKMLFEGGKENIVVEFLRLSLSLKVYKHLVGVHLVLSGCHVTPRIVEDDSAKKDGSRVLDSVVVRL